MKIDAHLFQTRIHAFTQTAQPVQSSSFAASSVAYVYLDQSDDWCDGEPV